jgi:hypothetical protein
MHPIHERIAYALLGFALFVGMLACMLEYFDVLVK